MDMLSGNGHPSRRMFGEVGQHYKDLNTGDIYECISSNEHSRVNLHQSGGYVWKKIARGDHLEVCGGGSADSSGGGWDAVIKMNDNLGYASTAEIILAKGDYASLCAKALTVEPIMIACICDYVYGSHRMETHIAVKVFFYDVDSSDDNSANRIFVTFGTVNGEYTFTIKEDNTVVYGEVHD